MPSAKMDIIRNAEGTPTQIKIERFGRITTVIYDDTKGFVFQGQRDEIPNVFEMLSLVFPEDKKDVFTIPDPLNVVNVQGGKIVLFDDMEGLLKWVGAAASQDNTFCFGGSNSLKVAAAAGASVSSYRYFPMSLSTKIQLSLKFSLDDFTKLEYLTFGLIFCNHIDIDSTAALRVDANGLWSYRTTGGGYTSLIDTNLRKVAWHNLTFEVDFTNQKYLNASINDKSLISIKDQNIFSAGAGGNASAAWISLGVDAAAGQDVNASYDDVLIKEI